MTSNFKQNIQQISGMLLLTLFVGYFVGITFFPHKHIVDGRTIVHSHPFSSTEQHSHTTNTLDLLQQISSFVTKTLTFGILIIAYLKLNRVIGNDFNRLIVVSDFKYSNFLRPPPYGI